MLFHFTSIFLTTALVAASPLSSHPMPGRATLAKRVVTELNQAATEEAQQRDNTATRAFTGATIKTGSGQCLFVDELSGDFRENLTPVQAAACDGSAGQTWDVLTTGKHNDKPGNALIVSGKTNACLNFDPRRAAGDQVILFSCGGRADGDGKVTDSQLFPFPANGTATGSAKTMTLSPANAPGTCLTMANGKRLDPAPCAKGDTNQLFTIS